MKLFGEKNLQWALMATGFVVGIPLFYNVGFVLMVPIIFSAAYQYKLPAVYIGLPMLAALSVTHGFLPPHPSPSALVTQFHANMGLTLMYGFMVAIPAIIIAGPIFSKTLKNIKSVPLQIFQPKNIPAAELPGTANSFLSSLLPVVLLALTTVLPAVIKGGPAVQKFFAFVGDPIIVMTIAVITATFTLGIGMGKSMKSIMNIYGDAVKDIAMILLIVAGAGVLKQVFTDSGVSQEIGRAVQNLHIQPLVLGWLIAAIIRVCLGSATVAGLTAAGIIAPMMAQGNVHPSLMVLSIGAGSLMFSHVNDGGFWMFKEYFNLSMKGHAPFLVAHGIYCSRGRTLRRTYYQSIYINILYMQTVNIEEKLQAMGLVLPTIPPSKGIYKSCLTAGNFLFVSGHVSLTTEGKFITGKVGSTISEEDGFAAARQCGLAILTSIKAHLGDLNKLKRVIKILGMVNCGPDFEKHAIIINGCSELFVQLLGDENGKGVRSAVGMGSLPGNVAVEVEAMFEMW